MNNSDDSDNPNSTYKKSKFSRKPQQDEPMNASQEDYYTPQSQRGLLSPSYRQKASSPTAVRDNIKKLTKPIVFIRRASNDTSSHNTSERKSVRFSVYNDSIMSGVNKLDPDTSKSFISNDQKGHRNSRRVSRMSKMNIDSNGSLQRKSVSSQHSQYSNRSGIRKSRLQRIEEQVSESGSGNNSTLMDIQNMYYTKWDNDKDEEYNEFPALSKKARHKPNPESIKQVYYTMLKKKMTRRRNSVRYEDDPEFTEQIQTCKDGGYIPNNEKLRDLEIVDKTSYEKAKVYGDKYPLLSWRRTCLKWMKFVTYMCNKIIKHPLFEYFILGIIILNSVVLALDDPTTDGPDNSFSTIMDKVFLAIYTLEMTLKIFGMGFILSRNSYLRDAWNIMDFVIVVTAYLPYIVSSGNVGLQSLRSLRVLRPLRTISNIEALRVLIGTLIAALGPLLDTLFIVFFLFVIFAIGGLQLFAGVAKKRCFALETGIPMVDLTEQTSDYQQYCNADSDCGTIDGIYYVCGKMIKNPNGGATHFDTFANSMLMVFQIVTLEGWSDIMRILNETFTPFAAFYFVALIFLGAFFLLNLTLAVLKTSFTDNSQKTLEESLADNRSYEVKLAERLRDYQVDIIGLINKKKEGILMYNKFLLTKRQVRAIEDKQAKKFMAERFRSKRRMATQQIANQVKRIGGSFLDDLKKRFSFRPSFFTVVKQATEANKPQESRFQKAMRSAKVAPDTKKQEVELSPSNLQVSNTPSINLLSPKENESPAASKRDFSSPKKNHQLARTQESEWRSPESAKNLLSPLGSPTERKSLIPKKQNFLSIEYSEKSPENKIRDSRHSVFLMTPSSSNNLFPGVNTQELTPKRSLLVAPRIEIGSIKEVEDDELESSPLGKRAERGRSDGTLETLVEIGPRPELNKNKKVSLSAEKTGKKGVKIINIAGVVSSLKIQPAMEKKNANTLIRLNKMSIGDLDSQQTIAEKRMSVQDDLKFFDLVDNPNQPETVEVKKVVIKDPIMTRINQIKALKFKEDSKKRRSVKSVSSRRKSKAPSLDLTEDVNFDPKKGSLDIPSALLNDSDFMKNPNKGDRQTRKRRAKKDHSHKSRREGKSSTKISNLTKQKSSSSPKRGGGSSGDLQIRSKDFDRRKGKGSSKNLTGSLGSLIEVEEDKKEPKFVIDVRHLKVVPKRREYQCVSVDDVMPSVGENKRKQQEEKEAKYLREHRLPIQFKITKWDDINGKKIAADHYDVENENRQSSIAVRVSKYAQMQRQKQKEEEDFDKEIGEIIEKQAEARMGTMIHSGRSSLVSSLSRRKSLKIRRKGNLNAVGGPKVEEDDYLAPEKMKNYYEVLARIKKPFENEKASAKKEKNPDGDNDGFNLVEEHKAIRRKDIENQKIQESNWSGDAIIPINKASFPIKRVKLALNVQERELWIPGVYGLYCEVRRRARQFAGSDLFNNFILICVIINTIILASDGLVTDDATSNAFDDLNMAFTIVFIVEMALKIFGFGIIRYVNERINLFDAAIVVISIVEWVISSGGGSKLSAFRAIRLFRTFRVLRVTKLLRSLSYMQAIIGVMMRSIKKFIYIAVLLFLMIFIYALLGMQIFGGEFNYINTSGVPKARDNFDTFIHAFVSVFQLMTQENWFELLFTAMQSSVSKPLALLYLISWIFIGNYIFLNLVVAILLDEFTVEKVEEDLYEEPEDDENMDHMSTRDTGFNQGSLSLRGTGTFSKELSKVKSSTTADFESIHDIEENAKKEDVVILFDKIRCSNTFYIFSKGNRFRIACYKIVKNRYFDRTILAVIVLSSIKLALDTYISSSDTELSNISDIFDYIINVVFLLEAFFKIIAYGFALDGNSYLRETWNILDFLIVVASIFDMSLEGANLSFIRILRLLRTLRPLRFISHNQNMRLVVTALLESVGAIFNVVIVIVIIWLMFAILAVNIVGDKLGYCGNLPNGISKYGISQTQCISMGYIWTNPHVNFDNVINGMLSLFIVSTQENWNDIMYSVVDAADPTTGPIEEENALFGYIYFMVFLFVGSYFLLNLFVGVIFLKFLQAQKRENKLRTFLTPEQEDWVTLQRLILLVKPYTSFVEPETQWRKPFFRFITKPSFDVFIIGCIILNIITLALNYDDESDSYNNALAIANVVFSAIFITEMILKLLALGFRRYWANNWNKFDAFVVIVSIMDIVLTYTQSSSGSSSFLRAGPQIARVLRVLRVSRLIKLIKRFEGLQKIINTLVFSLPALFNVGALLMLVFFIYAILATFLFGTIAQGNDINGIVNFVNFSNALLTLFRCSTGEDWWVIMFDTMYPISCTEGNSTCGTPAGAVVFWLTFIVICQFIFLNLFILVILQQFEAYYLNPDNPVNKFREDLENIFKPTWAKFTEKYQGIEIPENQLLPFFQELPVPLGFKNTGKTKKEIAKEITQMNLVSDLNNMLFYNDILFGIYKHIHGNEKAIGSSEFLVKEEIKSKRRLDHVRKKEVTAWKAVSKTLMASIRKNKASVNPMVKILFLGMTMRAWMKYAKKTASKMQAAKDNEYEYISSGSDQQDYTYIVSNVGDSSYNSEDDDDYEESETSQEEQDNREENEEEESGEEKDEGSESSNEGTDKVDDSEGVTETDRESIDTSNLKISNGTASNQKGSLGSGFSKNLSPKNIEKMNLRSESFDIPHLVVRGNSERLDKPSQPDLKISFSQEEQLSIIENNNALSPFAGNWEGETPRQTLQLQSKHSTEKPSLFSNPTSPKSQQKIVGIAAERILINQQKPQQEK